MVDSKVDAWFDSSPSGQKIALTTLRGMIRAVVTDAIEEIKWGRPCYSFESGLFCYLYTTNTHVALGFQCGSELDDPDDVLEGTGKDMRHIKLKVTDDISYKRDSIRALLTQAAKS